MGDKPSAKQQKFLPCTNKDELLTMDYEIYSKVHNLVSMKIREDLKFLQREMKETSESAIATLKNFQLYMESGSTNFELFSSLVDIIIDLQKRNQQFIAHVRDESVPAVYLMGGHRSFLVCVMETVTKLAATLEDIGNAQKKITVRAKDSQNSVLSLRTSSNIVQINETSSDTNTTVKDAKVENSKGTLSFRRHKRNASQDPRSGYTNSKPNALFSLFSTPDKKEPAKPLTTSGQREIESGNNIIESIITVDIIESEAALKSKLANYEVKPPKKIQRPKNRVAVSTLRAPLQRAPISREDLSTLMKNPSRGEVPVFPEKDDEVLAGLNETQRLIVDNYAYVRNQTVKGYTQSIDQLTLKITQLKAELEKKLELLKEEEKNALENWQEEQIKSKIKMKTRQIRNLDKSMAMLKDVHSKLIVCSKLKPTNLFMPVDEMYKDTGENQDAIFTAHLGYEINPALKAYGKKMKVVYCAVADSFNTGMGMYIPEKIAFASSAAWWMMGNQGLNTRYGDLRSNIKVEFVKNVWDLLEDKMTRNIATTLGLAPGMDKMKTNHQIWIRVPLVDVSSKKTIPNDLIVSDQIEIADEKGSTAASKMSHVSKYGIRCLFISPFSHVVCPSLLEDPRPKNVSDRANFPIHSVQTKSTPKKRDHRTKRQSTVHSHSPPSNTDPAGFSNTIIVHIHGGGWVSQSPDVHLSYCSEWAKTCNSPILSIDYSLSPRVQFPTALNECYAVYKWLQQPKNTRKLGIFSENLNFIITGDSAGGNLTAAVILKAIKTGLPTPVGSLMHYPALNLRDNGSISRLIFSHDPILNLQTMRCVLECYLGVISPETDNNSLVSPLFATNEEIAQFPRTVLIAGDVDPLIDDSTSFYHRLQTAGVEVLLKVFRALPHGYLNLPTQLPKAYGAISDAGGLLNWLVESGKKGRAATIIN